EIADPLEPTAPHTERDVEGHADGKDDHGNGRVDIQPGGAGAADEDHDQANGDADEPGAAKQRPVSESFLLIGGVAGHELGTNHLDGQGAGGDDELEGDEGGRLGKEFLAKHAGDDDVVPKIEYAHHHGAGEHDET